MRELKEMTETGEFKELSKIADILIGRANYFGYGLYADAMIKVEDFLKNEGKGS